ncbi:MAG: hypothetical protein Q8P52_00015 [bacterium]|nr:hypothetical protein [bacterium]
MSGDLSSGKLNLNHRSTKWSFVVKDRKNKKIKEPREARQKVMKNIIRFFAALFAALFTPAPTTASTVENALLPVDFATGEMEIVPVGPSSVSNCALRGDEARLVNGRKAIYTSRAGNPRVARIVAHECYGVVVLRRGRAGTFRRAIMA